MAKPSDKAGASKSTPPAPDAAAEAERLAAEDAARAAAAEAARLAAEEADAAERERVMREAEEAARLAALRTPRDGHALLVAPNDATGASAGGASYVVREDGCIEVRSEHVAELLNHGFVAVE